MNQDFHFEITIVALGSPSGVEFIEQFQKNFLQDTSKQFSEELTLYQGFFKREDIIKIKIYSLLNSQDLDLYLPLLYEATKLFVFVDAKHPNEKFSHIQTEELFKNAEKVFFVPNGETF